MQQKSPLYPTLVAASLTFVLYLLGYFWFDIPIDTWIYQHLTHTPWQQISRELGRLLDPKYFLTLSVLMLIATLFQPLKSCLHVRIWALGLFISLVICLFLKYTLARYRPELFFSEHWYGFHGFSMKKSFNSTPSGHATALFASFYGLAKLYRRAWLTLLCLALATLISITRVLALDHFPSDVIFGAFLGMIAVTWINYLYKQKETV